MQITRLRELDGERALTIGETTLTYGRLRRLAGGVAARLAGVRRVAVWAEPTVEAIVAIVGLVESGVEVVPLNPKLGSAELDHILEDSQPEVLLERGVLAVEGELRPAPEDGEQVALVVYTSGTTGKPKGVLMPRRAIVSNLDALAEAWAVDRRATALAHALPIFHVHGLVLGRSGRCACGGHVRHLGAFSPEAVAAALAGGDTMLFGVPTMYHRLAEAAEHDAAVARGAGRRAAAGVGVGGAAGKDLRADRTRQRPADRRALRPDRDDHEHRRARRWRATSWRGRPAVDGVDARDWSPRTART